jgi:alanine racemase
MAAAIPSGYADGINRHLMGAYAEPAETAKLTAELKDCNNSTSEKSV